MTLGPYESYIHKSRYARYLPEENRRETWEETVNRYVTFWKDRGQLDDETGEEIYNAILNLEVMPSMRCLMTAGPALDRDNVAGFNCSYLPISSPRDFDELMYILLCGTGVGFSVEEMYVHHDKMPVVSEEMHDTGTSIKVGDSKVGWASAFRELVSLLYSGKVPSWDTSGVRPAGAPLKTFGGRASGPAPLIELFRFTVELFKGSAGRKLTTLECHDLVCKIADVVVVGGVRRSALIGLSDLNDDRVRRAKVGDWRQTQGQRELANNSAVYTEKPDFATFNEEWKSLYESYSGERGIFSRVAAQKVAARNGRREADVAFGTNPCSEIILRPHQFCNLSEVVVRPNDTYESLARKVRIATIMGTLQATLTDFRYLRKIWKNNTEEEALLGVSMTGIMDHPFLSGHAPQMSSYKNLGALLTKLKEKAVDTNKEWAEKLGIKQSAAITCVKPSGTVSQLVDSASGIHARFDEYYIRRVRADIKDPLCQVLIDAGIPYEPQQNKPETLIFDFYKKAPKGVYASDQTAIEQAELWSTYQEFWCEHKPSITIYYRDSDFLELGQWVYNNFDTVSGCAFLPYDGGVYAQAPYESITKDAYELGSKKEPESLDFDLVEHEDVTESSQQLACVGTSCEI